MNEEIIYSFSIGLGLWFLTWGVNRVYLTVKQFLG